MKKMNYYYSSRYYHYHTIYLASPYSQAHEDLEDQTQIHSFLSSLAQSRVSFSSFYLYPYLSTFLSPSTFLSSFLSSFLSPSLTPSSRCLSTYLNVSSSCPALFVYSFYLLDFRYRLLAHHSLPIEPAWQVAPLLHGSLGRWVRRTSYPSLELVLDPVQAHPNYSSIRHIVPFGASGL